MSAPTGARRFLQRRNSLSDSNDDPSSSEEEEDDDDNEEEESESSQNYRLNGFRSRIMFLCVTVVSSLPVDRNRTASAEPRHQRNELPSTSNSSTYWREERHHETAETARDVNMESDEDMADATRVGQYLGHDVPYHPGPMTLASESGATYLPRANSVPPFPPNATPSRDQGPQTQTQSGSTFHPGHEEDDNDDHSIQESIDEESSQSTKTLLKQLIRAQLRTERTLARIVENRPATSPDSQPSGAFHGRRRKVRQPKLAPNMHSGEQLSLMEKIRDYLAHLEQRVEGEDDFPPPPSAQEVAAYEVSHIGGPTDQDFRVAYDWPPMHPWNKRAMAIFCEKFLAHFSDDHYDSELISERIWVHIRGRRQKWRKLKQNRTEGDLAQEASKARARTRRLSLYYRRIDGAGLNGLTNIRNMVAEIGAQGMSSDESDRAMPLPRNSHTRHSPYKIRARRERSQSVTQALRLLDTLHYRARISLSGNLSKGMPPRLRVSSTIVSRAPPVFGLPRNYYGDVWYRSLTAREKTMVRARSNKPIDIPSDYAAYLDPPGL
ncbi:hypothetical protein SISNIDRAFT_491405 [Sistotremastrum niveocremeum HHB9708]|uniref:Uncharacterized protein n=1 Tax=Sistotremastrum niveocremeum HHB9708 TaxID=1314777 RepID=A0A164MUR6_9AGAM|nr:hypothetical protein SISNIDRAFT_491405 [Sistotremastrum niveocremeum HHB9708]